MIYIRRNENDFDLFEHSYMYISDNQLETKLLKFVRKDLAVVQ